MKNILYIDDNTQAGLLAKIYFEKENYHVYTCTNTKKGRLILSQNPVHFIIIDIGLPGENGIDFYKWLQQQPEYKKIPALIVSAHATGLDDIIVKNRDIFMAKPIFFPGLIDRINKLLNVKDKNSKE